MGGLKRASRVRRTAASGALAGLLLALLAAPVSAVVLYTAVVTPLSATQWSSTSFSVTVSNLNLIDDLGCLEFDLPPSFEILSVSVPVASNGDPWISQRNGQTVIAHSDGGGGRLELGESVAFAIRARPQAAGAFTWPNHGHRDQDCGGSNLLGSPVALTVLPGAEPTPLPTIAPTPLPTLPPTPLPTLPPSLLPSLPPILRTPAPTPPPTHPAASTATPRPSQRPDAEGSRAPPDRDPATPAPAASSATPPEGPDAAQTSDGEVGPGASGSGPFAGPTGARVSLPDLRGGVDVRLGPLGVLAGGGDWLVPAAIIGGPGLLVVLFVSLQVAGALAWLPAVRRLRGDGRASR